MSQGIGVFAPNVRGSSGFGKKFVNLDNGPLRVNGVRDIQSCAEYLTKNGIADPKRLGITGGSYGGYMTMAGVTEFPELFAAGANLFGIVNFKTFFEQSEPWMAAISTTEYGDPATQADLLATLSPIHKLATIKAAMMVLHGANDTNVPVVEAEQIVENLRSRQRAGRVHPVPGRRARLAEGSEPHSEGETIGRIGSQDLPECPRSDPRARTCRPGHPIPGNHFTALS